MTSDELGQRLDDMLAQLDRLEGQLALQSTALWRYREIALYLRVSESTARRMVHHPAFPHPCQPPSNDAGNRVPPRWVPERVKAFAASHPRDLNEQSE